jgi:hypothetical protein
MRFLRTLPVVAALVLVAPATSASAAATAHVVDPTGDVGYSFDAQADVTAADVRWDDAKLTVALTYAAPPSSTDLDLLVSSAAGKEDDPAERTCDTEVLEAFRVRAQGGSATLTIPDVDGSLTAQGVWSGTTITYIFSAPVLVRAWTTDRVDPFACLEGASGDDRFFGAFDGKVLKLTPEAMAAAVVAEARRRYGARGDAWARCPWQGISDEYPDADGNPGPATAFCAFEHRTGTALRSGSTSVYLASGVPRFLRFGAVRLPATYRSCGAYDGRWRMPPIFGAGMELWAQKVPCISARRVALRWRGRSRVGSYRCRVLRQGEEYVKVRCTRPGGRVVRWEAGA